MSHVTNILLSFSVAEDYYDSPQDYHSYTLMDAINKWLIDRGYGAFGRDVDHVSGGNKHLEPPMFAAGFNHFNLPAFLGLLRTLSWIEPENVQVFVQEDDQDRFYIIEPCAPAAVVQSRAEQAFVDAWQQMDDAMRHGKLEWMQEQMEP